MSKAHAPAKGHPWKAFRTPKGTTLSERAQIVKAYEENSEQGKQRQPLTRRKLELRQGTRLRSNGPKALAGPG